MHSIPPIEYARDFVTQTAYNQGMEATLFVVATPIGNLGDFSPRALETLKQVDFILAEDTRHSQKLLQHFGVHTPLYSCHEHNERERSEAVVKGLCEGKSYALISDAGTPVFSDPGAKLVAAVQAFGLKIVPIPGPCAAIAALSASGLPGLPFHFYGFLPYQMAHKRGLLEALKKTVFGTIAFYESPHRLLETLEMFATLFGEAPVVLAKELTKTFECIRKGPASSHLAWLNEDSKRGQGEFVLLFENAQPPQTDTLSLSLEGLLTLLLKHVSLKEAVAEAVTLSGLPKNKVYEQALALKS